MAVFQEDISVALLHLDIRSDVSPKMRVMLFLRVFDSRDLILFYLFIYFLDFFLRQGFSVYPCNSLCRPD